jgi:indole-3-glycerol phosphate synthase
VIASAAQADVLGAIVAATRRSVAVRQAERSRAQVEADAARWQPRGPAMLEALAAPGLHVLAECKRRSPSKGVLCADYDPVAVAMAYAAAGARAISVLTEPTFFDGSLSHLRDVRARVPTLLLRKDFIVDEYQLAEAQACGADAVLLIVAALDDAMLRRLRLAAEARGLAVLIEVHTTEECRRALDAGARLVGVNSRNLKTLSVSLETALTLAGSFPPGIIGVAESGIRTRADIDLLSRAGYRAFLVGERLMASGDPGGALRSLIGAGPC